MDVFFAMYIGALLKWIFSGFKNKFRNELYGKNKHIHLFKRFSVDNENILIGVCFSALTIALIGMVFF
jgi:hypothetical protein